MHLALPATLAALAPEGDRSLNALLEFASGATIWTLIVFVAALPVMWKFVYGPITKALEARDQKVEDAIKAAEVARQEAQQQMAAAKAELDKARADSKRMVEEAMARAERQAAEAARAADEKAKAELQKARDAIAAEKRQALQEIRTHVVELTMQATGRLLQAKVDDPTSRRLVEDFLVSAGTGKETR